MTYIRSGLYAEGRSDYQLLTPLLRRLTERVCLEAARCTVDVEDVQGLDAPRRFRGTDRATRILEAAREFWGGACVLFIHADGAGDPDAARATQLAPAVALIRERLPGGACVPVVPVREIEAWTLVDGDTLREAFGTTLADEELHIARRPRDVEKILDPKQELREALLAAIGPSRRRHGPADFFTRIGERVDLSKLRQVPAFMQLEQDLRGALRRLGVLRGV
jgi:Domain of unknown function (DUF4276)